LYKRKENKPSHRWFMANDLCPEEVITNTTLILDHLPRDLTKLCIYAHAIKSSQRAGGHPVASRQSRKGVYYGKATAMKLSIVETGYRGPEKSYRWAERVSHAC
jgi:hypothetical protein